MTCTPSTLKARFTEFASVADARVQIFIDDAELEVDEDRWGDLYDKGVCYLAAHLLYIAEQSATGQGEGGGPLSTKTVGDVALTFGSYLATSKDAAVFNATIYGQEYYRLMMMVGMGAVAITATGVTVTT